MRAGRGPIRGLAGPEQRLIYDELRRRRRVAAFAPPRPIGGRRGGLSVPPSPSRDVTTLRATTLLAPSGAPTVVSAIHLAAVAPSAEQLGLATPLSTTHDNPQRLHASSAEEPRKGSADGTERCPPTLKRRRCKARPRPSTLRARSSNSGPSLYRLIERRNTAPSWIVPTAPMTSSAFPAPSPSWRSSVRTPARANQCPTSRWSISGEQTWVNSGERRSVTGNAPPLPNRNGVGFRAWPSGQCGWVL
jgi:hypothetical protein